MKKFILLFFAIVSLSACDGGGSDSGSMTEDTLPGTNVPTSFVGTYTGTLDITASALGITVTDSFPITVTVNDDATVRFDGDDPEETFTVGLQNDGIFRGNLPIDQEGCTGTVAAEGQVNGTTVTGTIEGDGNCTIDGVTADVTLEGTFNATRS